MCLCAHTRVRVYLLLFIPVTCFLFTVVEKRGFCSIYSLSWKKLCTGANIWVRYVEYLWHISTTKAHLPSYLPFFFERICTVCFSPSRAAISHLFVLQVLWERLPVGQVDVAHHLYHHNCWRRGGRKVLAHYINALNCWSNIAMLSIFTAFPPPNWHESLCKCCIWSTDKTAGKTLNDRDNVFLNVSQKK